MAHLYSIKVGKLQIHQIEIELKKREKERARPKVEMGNEEIQGRGSAHVVLQVQFDLISSIIILKRGYR